MITELEAAGDVVSWRRDQLKASGFPLPLAAGLAADRRYDVHALIELVERGCPPELAERILAPLEAA
ncbi:MAG TPA: hypothetical protein VFU10_04735 [Gaiellaceae bacterium]|nr:hypothetical protein [Gaiellaceae bacterium]